VIGGFSVESRNPYILNSVFNSVLVFLLEFSKLVWICQTPPLCYCCVHLEILLSMKILVVGRRLGSLSCTAFNMF